MNGVLVPQKVASLGGYDSRLLLETATAKNVNWTVVSALGSAWHTWSWNLISGDLPLVEILGNHLKALA